MLYRFQPPTDDLAVIYFKNDSFEAAIKEMNRSLIDPGTILVACPDDGTPDLVGMELREDPDERYSITQIRNFRIVRVSEFN
jgi:hypothetical protein